MAGSKIKTASKTTTSNGTPSNSKIKTSPKTTNKSTPPPSQGGGGYSPPIKLGGKKYNDENKDMLGSIDTYNTTDTGRQVIEVATPVVRSVSKKVIKTTINVTKEIPGKIEKRKLKSQDLEDMKKKLNVQGKVRTSKGNAVYKRVGSIRVENDFVINRIAKSKTTKNTELSRKIKTGGYKSNEIKTAITRKKIATQKVTQKTVIKTGTYAIGGYRLKGKLSYLNFKHTNAKVNENDTGNTSYEAMQDGRRKISKGTNIIRTGRNAGTLAKQLSRTIDSIGKEKVDVQVDHSPKIRTGRYVDPNKKRTLENSTSARQVSKTIHTVQAKADIKLDRLQGRNSYVGEKIGKEEFKSFTTTNAVVQEQDISNSSVEAFQESRVVTNKIRNTTKGIQNTYKFIKNIKTSVEKDTSKGGRIHTGQKSKIRTSMNGKKYGAEDVKAKANMARKTVATTQDIAIKIAGAIKRTKALMNPLVIKGSIIGGIFILFMSIITSVIGGISGSGGITYTYIMTEPEIIIEAKEKVDELNKKATEKIEKLLASTGYDDIKLEGPNKIEVGFQDILAIMGVEDEQEYNLSKINSIHEAFYKIDTRTEIYQENVYKGVCHHDKNGKCTSECHDEYELVDRKRLVIIVEQYNFIKVMDDRGFDEEQQNWGMNLAGCNLLEIYPELAEAGITTPQGNLTEGEINDILSKLPSTGATRENIVAIAESLVGKIAYGWGCKADPPAIPSKLDCSGFTDYVFKLAGAGTIGAGTYGQWDNSYPIDKGEIKIGDLGFLKPPSQASDSSPNHVGIFVGYDSNGNMMFVHCQGGTGTVKTTAQAAGFYYFRRPFVNFAE